MEATVRIKTATPSPYRIIAIHQDTHDTKTFRFGLPADATLDLFPGDHLYVHATIDGKTVKRPYTPSSMPGEAGAFDVTVKRYDNGTVSTYLHERQVGDTVQMSGPRPGGHWVDGMATKVGLVAGGSGITPMIAIIRWILGKRLAVDLSLLYANKTEADIIFRDEWERAAREHRNFRCYHVLSRPPAGWTQGSGRITEEVLRRHLPPPPVRAPWSFYAARRRWLMRWKRLSRASAIPRVPSFFHRVMVSVMENRFRLAGIILISIFRT